MRRPKAMSHKTDLAPDELLLDRYVAGDCTPAEREQVERWSAEDAAHARLVGWMIELKGAARGLPAPLDPDALWRTLEHRIAGAEPGAASEPAPELTREPAREPERARRAAAPRFAGVRSGQGTSWSVHLLRVAAVIALISASAALWRLADRQVPSHQTPAARSYATRPGERAAFNLTDGSRVTLGASSTLDVPDSYGRHGRDVYLHGQAYFEVVPNPEKPFRVHSGRAMTEVLGTKFGVRAYEGDSTVAVVVAEGRVALGARDGAAPGAVLTRGDLGRLESGGRVRVEHGVDVDQQLAWVHGRLEFVNAPLGEVLPELGRWYGLEFHLVDGALAARPLTASLGTESAADLLRLLEASLDLSVERRGQVVTLRRK